MSKLIAGGDPPWMGFPKEKSQLQTEHKPNKRL